MAVSSLKNKSKLSTLTSPFDIDLGGMIPLATVAVGAGGTSFVEFTDIPNTYAHLQVRYIARTSFPGSSNIISMFARFNSDSASNYAHHRIIGDGSAVSVGASANSGSFLVSYSVADGYASGMFGCGIIDILDYANNNKFKTVRTLGGVDTNNTGGEKGIMSLTSGLWRSTNTVTSIRIACASNLSTGLAQHSHFALYGIKAGA